MPSLISSSEVSTEDSISQQKHWNILMVGRDSYIDTKPSILENRSTGYIATCINLCFKVVDCKDKEERKEFTYCVLLRFGNTSVYTVKSAG